MKKRFFSMLLAIVMVVGLLPTAVFAAEGDNLCDHHTEHTADCGYAPAVEGSPCTHECGEECAEACTHVHDEACGYVEAAAEVPCGYVCEESHGEATRVIYVDESTFFASGYSHFYDANENLLTATREEQEDGWVKYTMPADAKYYHTFDGHMGGGGGGNYPELPTNADRYDPFSDTWSCSHPGYAEGYCRLCGEPCPGHTYDNACDDKCNVCSEIREVGDHVYDGAEDAECNECGYVRDITPAQITGVSITVDGVEYTEGNVTITPTSTITLTVTGTNLQNGTDDNRVDYAYGFGQTVSRDYFEISEDGTTATYAPPAGRFANSSNFEITYYNNYTDTDNRTAVPTGIYATYDDGIAEEDQARITGVSITVDDVEYTSGDVTITPTSTVVYTVTGEKFANIGEGTNLAVFYGDGSIPVNSNYCWIIDTEANTATCDLSAYIDWFEGCNNSEIRYSNDGSQSWTNTGIYLTYDDGSGDDNTGGEEDTTPAEITGVSITVDGETCTSGNVTITPDSTVILTITGTSLHNGSDDHTVDYANGLYLYVNPDYFEISEDGTTATYAPSTGDFAKSSNFEITYCNNYTDTANRTVVPTGIYLTYDDGIAEEDKAQITGMSITIDGVVYDSSNTSAEDPAVITPNTEFITITVHGTALQNCTTDHVVSYYSGSSEPILANNLWRFEADGNSAYHYYSSASALSDFARNTTPYELQYSNNGSFNAANPAIGSGVYIVYDDSTGGEEDPTSAEITGISITVDGETYTSGNVTITPTSTVTFTITGTNLHNGTEDHRVNYTLGFGLWATPDYCDVSEDGTTATFAPSLRNFTDCSNYEVVYYNNYTDDINRAAVSSGIYLTYESGIAEEDAARITGVSITVDGETYTSGNVTITPNSTITFTVTGTNLQNGTDDNYLEFAFEKARPVTPLFFTISEDGTSATFVPSFEAFADCRNYEIVYYNNYTDTDNRVKINTGIYLTYESGIAEEDEARITGVSITVDGVTHTSGDVTITPTSTITLTVTGTNLQNATRDHTVAYASGLSSQVSREAFEISEDGTTATTTLPALDFASCSHHEMYYYNNFIDTDNRTAVPTGIYLTYDDGSGDDNTGSEEDTTPAEITGVSITVDGVEYTTGDVTITPDTQSIIVTVTGTHFANLSDANILDLGPGLTVFMNTWRWEVDPAANKATADFSDLNPEFGDHNGSEITYSNDSNQNWTGTGIYLTYDDGTGGEEDTTPDSTGKILVDMQDSYGDGWNDAAIQIYKNGSLEQTVTVDKTSNTVFLDYDSTATYEFKWIKGGYDYECSFTIYEDGEEKLSVTDASVYENGETIWPQGDTGGEEGGDDTIGGEEDTTPAQITGVSITVDGVTYTEGDVTITPTSTIVFTITGTNFANLNDNNYLGCFFSTIVDSGHGFTIDTAANTATQDFTGIISAFEQCDDFEVIYSNDGTQSWIGTGIYLTYDDGTEANTTLAIGDNEIADGHTYTYTAEQDGSLYITVTELYYQETHEVTEVFLGHWCAIEINGTAITDFVNSTEVKTGDTVTVKLISVDGDTYNGTVNLSWDASVMAEITGVSIVIDGEEYVGSDTSAENPAVITSEAASVILTVHGTNLQYATDEQWVSYMSTGNCVTLDNSDWTKSEDGSLASLDLTFLTESFIQSVSVWEIKYSSNGGGLEDAVTGLYVKYEHIPEEEPIVIIQQPTDGEAKLGERYCVEVIAQGEGLKYQWYFRNAGASSFSKSSVTDSTYDDVMTKARMNRQVYCVITDSHGNSVTTDRASLIALKSVDLAITTLPESVTANYGERFTVTAEAVGDGVTYEWYYLDPDGAAWRSTNVRSATYSGKMSEKIDGRAVYCVATDIWGEMVATNSVFLRCERAELAITQQPNDASAKLGERFNVEVIAQGDGLKYQWYWRQIGDENWTVSGQRDNTYDDVMTSARHNREVYCVITDAWGDSVTTEIATITGTPTTTLAITRQPENQSVTIGDMFNVTFEAQGDGLKYQWYFRQAGTEVWYTSGQRDNSYDDVMTKARHNRELYCVVTDAWGNTVETDPIVVILATPRYELAITAQPENESVKMGEMFCVTVEAQGDELKYQWYWRNVGSENWNVSGQRDNTYDDVMTKARHNREVKCVITDMWGESVETNVVTITAIPDQVLTIVAQPTDAAAAMGENYCVTVEAQGDGLTYQWYFKNEGTDVWHVSGVKDNTYDDVMIESRAGRQVYCVITDIWGYAVTTETVTLVCTDIPQAIAMN